MTSLPVSWGYPVKRIHQGQYERQRKVLLQIAVQSVVANIWLLKKECQITRTDTWSLFRIFEKVLRATMALGEAAKATGMAETIVRKVKGCC
jgi:hypothetical protein